MIDLLIRAFALAFMVGVSPMLYREAKEVWAMLTGKGIYEPR